MKKVMLQIAISLFLLPVIHAQSEAEMKAWKDYMSPGSMHQWMAKSDGTWSADISSNIDSGTPVKSAATAKYKMIYNGLYQVGEYKGIMMGQPFEGQGILAYDNARQQFVSTWIDNMGSGVVVMTGTYDDKTRTLNLRGNQTDPFTKKESVIRQEIKFIDDDTQTLTMYGTNPAGKEMKMLDIRLTRDKGQR